MGAYYQNIRPETIKHSRKIQEWIEVWEYANDTIYRGFISEDSRGKVMFVFFEDSGLEWDLKPGLMALLELADNEAFDCTRIVACVPRSSESFATDLTRNLGWCGFSLTTLESFASYKDHRPLASQKWLFLVSEI